YGYIQRGPEVARRQGVPVYQVTRFREKPSAELAEQFVASGDFYWNSGIFAWKASAILAELQRQKPRLYEAVQRIAGAWGTGDQDAVLRREYETLEKVSIDYAVM